MDEEKSPWPGRIGLLLAVIVATCLSLWLLPDTIRQNASALHDNDYASIAGAVTGHVVVSVAIAFFFLYFLFLRPSGGGHTVGDLLIIILVVADVDAAVVYAAKSAGHERNFQYSQIVPDLQRLVGNFSVTQGETEDVLRARAANDARIVSGISINEAAQINRLRASYQAEMSALVLDGALKPKSLAADGGTKTARERIAQARALIRKYRDAEQKVFADTRALVRQAQVDESVRAQMMAAFDRSLRQRSAASEKLWDCEDAILAESDSTVHDLANSRSDWHAEGAVFMFTSHHDLNVYRAHVEKIHALAENERMLEAEAGDTVVTTVQSGLTN